jgi:hypothetical protein
MRNIFPHVTHIVERYTNNRAEPHISRPANENGECADSNPPGTRNGFSRSMMPCRILFRVARHYSRSSNHRLLRSRSFMVWRAVTTA